MSMHGPGWYIAKMEGIVSVILSYSGRYCVSLRFIVICARVFNDFIVGVKSYKFL